MKPACCSLIATALFAGLLVVTPAPAQPPQEPELAGWQKALQDDSPLVRKRVAVALGREGPKAAAAVPALEKLLRDADVDVRRAAAEALERIDAGGKAAPAQLAELQKVMDECARLRAERAEMANQLGKREVELEAMRRLLEETRTRLDAEQKQRLADRDRAVQAEIQARAVQARNQQLLAQTEEIQRRLEVEKRKLELTGQATRPPAPADVRGQVKEVDTKTGLVVITVGADAGLARGHELEVYRLAPEPGKSVYLGRLQVMDVSPKEAVGRFTGARRGVVVQAGDQVAARIAAGEKSK